MPTLRSAWRHYCLPSASALVLSLSLQAQEVSATPPAGPGEPFALLVRASKLNNLAVDDVQPWHIKATFQLFNDQGNPADEGTYEEFWAGPRKFKRIFKGKGFSETRYGSEHGDLHADVQGDVPPPVSNARRELVSPLPVLEGVKQMDLAEKEVVTGALKLTCLTLTASIATHCFNQSEPILRISSYPGSSLFVSRNRMLRFQERAIPGDLKMVRAGQTLLNLHVDLVENLADANDAFFAAPADAVPAPILVQISGAVAQGMLEYKVAPDYPPAAKDARMTGTVVLQAKIGKDGRIKDLKVVSGAKVFQGSAMQAVQQWRYRPYLLNGEPVEVMTTINVLFTLGVP